MLYIALRYGWNPTNTSTKCDCGKAFVIEHVCNDVPIEPDLQPITNETFWGASAKTQDGARLDISANGVWGGRLKKTYTSMSEYSIPMLHLKQRLLNM